MLANLSDTTIEKAAASSSSSRYVTCKNLSDQDAPLHCRNSCQVEEEIKPHAPAFVSPHKRPQIQSLLSQATVLETPLAAGNAAFLYIYSRFNVVNYFLVSGLDLLITAKPEGRDVQRCRIPRTHSLSTLQFIHRIQNIHWADD